MAIHSFVPFLHVQSVLRSQAFYEILGLRLQSRFGPDERPIWARMQAPGCDLMLSQADGPVDPSTQAVLFYLHTYDLATVRDALLAGGCEDGGAFEGHKPGLSPACGVFFDTTFPHWMPDGQMRVHDLDGYVLLVGQLPRE